MFGLEQSLKRQSNKFSMKYIINVDFVLSVSEISNEIKVLADPHRSLFSVLEISKREVCDIVSGNITVMNE